MKIFFFRVLCTLGLFGIALGRGLGSSMRIHCWISNDAPSEVTPTPRHSEVNSRKLSQWSKLNKKNEHS